MLSEIKFLKAIKLFVNTDPTSVNIAGELKMYEIKYLLYLILH